MSERAGLRVKTIIITCNSQRALKVSFCPSLDLIVQKLKVFYNNVKVCKSCGKKCLFYFKRVLKKCGVCGLLFDRGSQMRVFCIERSNAILEVKAA